MKRILALIAFVITFTALAEAQTATFVNHVTPDFRQYYAADGRLGTYYPILGDSQSCEARQDIVLQVAPIGCQPAVVRSDLLAEQNVPVFCQLQAIQINPLVDVKQIRNIRFSGSYPKEVAGTGFHPANAALRTRDILLGNPLLNDVGYVTVVLKKNPNENELPDSVNVSLTARLDYYAGTGFGVGASEFLLQELSDQKWQSVKNKQSFLNGDYYLKLEEADPEKALVSIYHHDRRIQTVNLDRSRASDEVYLPGSYCQFGLKFRYNGFISPENVARLRVGEDIIEVYRGSSFLNGKCKVREIKTQGNHQGNIDLTCGSERFSLSITPQGLEIGEIVRFTNEDKLWKISAINKDGSFNLENIEGTEVRNNIQSGSIVPIDEGKLYEAVYSPEIENYLLESFESYESIATDYPAEENNAGYYGQQALERAIRLADNVNKEQTQVRLINLILEQYPNSGNNSYYKDMLTDIYNIDSEKASVVIDIDNDYKTIKLLDFRIPDEVSSVGFIWGAEAFDVEQGNSTSTILGNVTVNRIERTGVSARIVCSDGSSTSLNIRPDESQNVCDRVIRITNLDVKDFARIRIDPVTRSSGETNLTVYVGIEKRAIKLSPDKTKEKIENLNKSIEKWESISSGLGDVVTGMKAACFATSGVLLAKGFLTGLSGEALARQKVMRDEGGWTARCEEAFNSGRIIEGDSNNDPYSSINDCFRRNSNSINRDVNAMSDALNSVNQRVKGIQGGYVKESGFFESVIVDSDGLKAENLQYLKQTYGNSNVVGKAGDKEYVLGEVVRKINDTNGISLDKISDIELYTKLINTPGISPEQKRSYEQRLGYVLSDVNKLSEEKESVSDLDRKLKDIGINTGVDVITTGRDIRTYDTRNVYPASDNLGLGVSAGTPIHVMEYNGDEYLLVLDKVNDRFLNVNRAYKLLDSGNLAATPADDGTLKSLKKLSFRSLPGGSYRFPFAQGEAVVRYHEREPYKGMPAMVPISKEEGWYAGTEQTLPGFGNIKAFDSSGRIVSFYICNVMDDGRVGFFSPGFGDDECMRFDLSTGQPLDVFPDLSSAEAKNLVDRAIKALNDAARGYGKQTVNVLGQPYPTGKPASSAPGTQCQDFMSPEDCQIMFNVCDPVICPSSRCDFGGTYPVDNVIQSGVVGSALLCLPNVKEGIAVPVCLTGIKAGIDGYLSILKSHQACLQENLETGRNVGICDAITSVYTCEFFWRQAAPLANVILPKIVEYAYTGGQGQVRGGGEYLTVQSAWSNTQESVDYFTKYYADDSLKAFQIRSVEEAGTPFCKAFVSAKSPTSFKTLFEPDSPAQFHAWFKEITFSDATVPATSQYKVFYHIFAGNDGGSVYSVYLKDPPEISYYRSTPRINVASGYAGRGQAVSETKDFTAPAGYKQLCVRINDQEECGFGQVSTSFAINYLKDSIVKDEIERKEIKTESECISGGVNPAALLNPNIQEAAQEAIDPAVYKRGIVRICATDNPGRSTDPTRFKEVGICGDDKLKCWLDTNSISEALSESIPNVEGSILNETLENLGEDSRELLEDQGFVVNEVAGKDIENVGKRIDKLVGSYGEWNSQKPEGGQVTLLQNDIDSLSMKLFFDRDKAALIFERGRLYEGLGRILIGPNVRGNDNPGKVEDEEVQDNIDSEESKEEEPENVQESNRDTSNPEIRRLFFSSDGREVSNVRVGDQLSLNMENSCFLAELKIDFAPELGGSNTGYPINERVKEDSYSFDLNTDVIGKYSVIAECFDASARIVDREEIFTRVIVAPG